MKRFPLEATARHQTFLGENAANKLAVLTDTPYPRLLVTMGGTDDYREPIELDAESFIGVKSAKARGKRVTTLNVASVEELEPLRQPEPEAEQPIEESEITDEAPLDDEPTGIQEPQEKSQQDVADEMNGQLHLFD